MAPAGIGQYFQRCTCDGGLGFLLQLDRSLCVFQRQSGRRADFFGREAMVHDHVLQPGVAVLSVFEGARIRFRSDHGNAKQGTNENSELHLVINGPICSLAQFKCKCANSGRTKVLTFLRSGCVQNGAVSRSFKIIAGVVGLAVVVVIALRLAAPGMQESFFYPQAPALPAVVSESVESLLARLEATLRTN